MEKNRGPLIYVFPKEDFRLHVAEYAGSITANAPMALQVVKEIVDATGCLDEEQALAVEREKAASNVLSGQCIEGIAAFLEKRAPNWSGDGGAQ